MRGWLVVGILLAAFHWETMSAIILYQWHPSSINYMWITALMVIALGGSVVLSITNKIRILYPLFLIVPDIFVLFVCGKLE
jgi:hypothetical protein